MFYQLLQNKNLSRTGNVRTLSCTEGTICFSGEAECGMWSLLRSWSTWLRPHSKRLGVRGHQRAWGEKEERAEGEGRGGGLGVEFTTTPAWVLEPWIPLHYDLLWQGSGLYAAWLTATIHSLNWRGDPVNVVLIRWEERVDGKQNYSKMQSWRNIV